MFEELIPDLQEPARALLLAAGQAGLHPRVTSTVRGRTEQARLYRRYQSGLAKYPVAPPGTSAHEFGYAFDMVCTPLDALADVGYTWTTWGGIWHPSDEVHFEYPGFVPPFDLASATGTAMGEATGFAFAPAISVIPYLEKTLKVTAEHDPYATASLASQLAVWWSRL
jgi:hypothetical protein